MKRNEKQHGVNSILIVAFITLAMTSCKKTDNSIASLTPQGTQEYRSQSIVQARTGIKVAQTFPIHIQDASVRSTEDVAVSMIAAPYVDSALLSTIFEDVLSQGEELWGRYFIDGQYAYASNIRHYIQFKYGLACEKLFIFGQLTAVSPRYGCCASWVYDVACVLRGKDGMVYVIDPRLFSSVVTQKTWTGCHTRPSDCVPHPYLKSEAVVAGDAFTPLDNIPSGYLIEKSDGSYTRDMVAYYKDSVGCQLK